MNSLLKGRFPEENLPEEIREYTGGRRYESDQVGMSRAGVWLFEDMALKIEEESPESDHEARVMEWLQGKLPVLEVLCHKKQEGMSYLLMSRLPGVMSCDRSLMAEPERLTEILAKGLRMLWQVDISECPFDCGLDRKLAMARYQVEHSLVDIDNVEPETFGEGGFESPQALLSWLERNRPKEDLVFSHGDYCLPNVFVKEGEISGFLDLGKTGIADRYQDIALCYRSLMHNYEGKYQGVSVGGTGGFRPERLFELLGMEPDREKIRYYILLDELF